MAKPQFGDGLYMFIHVHTAHVRLNRYRRLFFFVAGVPHDHKRTTATHQCGSDSLPVGYADQTLFKCLPPAFRCLNSQPNFAYPYSPGFPWKTGKKNDLPSAKKFPRWQKCSCFLPLGFHDFHHRLAIARWPAGKVSWFDLTRWALGFVVHSRPKRPSELSASNPVTNYK